MVPSCPESAQKLNPFNLAKLGLAVKQGTEKKAASDAPACLVLDSGLRPVPPENPILAESGSLFEAPPRPGGGMATALSVGAADRWPSRALVARAHPALLACGFSCSFSVDQPGHALPGFATQDGLSAHQEPPQGPWSSFLNRASGAPGIPGAPSSG
jgi:hypothetical protein